MLKQQQKNIKKQQQQNLKKQQQQNLKKLQQQNLKKTTTTDIVLDNVEIKPIQISKEELQKILHIPTEAEIQAKIEIQNERKQKRLKEIDDALKQRDAEITAMEKQKAEKVKDTMKRIKKGLPLFDK